MLPKKADNPLKKLFMVQIWFFCDCSWLMGTGTGASNCSLFSGKIDEVLGGYFSISLASNGVSRSLATDKSISRFHNLFQEAFSCFSRCWPDPDNHRQACFWCPRGWESNAPRDDVCWPPRDSTCS